MENPTVHDPVYKVCQRVFHKKDDLALRRDMPIRRAIRRLAYRRFLHGCPPRKRSDTSIGDAFNWEWMVHCATEQKAGLVIVTRDTDYGATVGDKCYINDHLRQEFSDRVSRKRDLLLYPSLSDALKLFEVAVTPQEEQAEKELTSTRSGSVPLSSLLTWNQTRHLYGDAVFEALKVLDLTGDLMVKGADTAIEAKAIPVPESTGNLAGHSGSRRTPSK